MNPLRLTILAIFSTLWFANANDATATPVAPIYTYFFTAASPSPYDGSSISIQGLNIVAWDLFGDSNGGLQSGTGDGSFVNFNGVSTADANTWTGSFQIESFGSTAPTFFGTLSYTGTNTSSGGPTSGSLSSSFAGTRPDPIGSWSATPVAAPDSGTTLALLGIACGALGVYHRRVRVNGVRS